MTELKKLLPMTRVIEITSLSKSTVWRALRAGEFPRPIRLSARRLAWVAADIEAWVAGRVAASLPGSEVRAAI